jgi:hypothetical protein
MKIRLYLCLTFEEGYTAISTLIALFAISYSFFVKVISRRLDIFLTFSCANLISLKLFSLISAKVPYYIQR